MTWCYHPSSPARAVSFAEIFYIVKSRPQKQLAIQLSCREKRCAPWLCVSSGGVTLFVVYERLPSLMRGSENREAADVLGTVSTKAGKVQLLTAN